MTPPLRDPSPLSYTIPSFYVNNTHIIFINGIFRITFFEQHITKNESDEISEILVPRTSITMTPQSAQEFLRAFGEFNAKIEEIMKAAKEVVEGGRTMQ